MSRVMLALLGVWASVGFVEPLAAQGSVSGTVRNGGRPLDGAAVYLVPLDRDSSPAAAERAVIDQVHLRFVPNIVTVTPGSEVTFLNSDGVLHNVFGPGLDGSIPFDLGTYDRGESRTHTFGEEGVHVVLCHVHPEMAAYVVVTPSPFRGRSAADGRFLIGDVPAGRYRLVVWHPRHWREEMTMDVEVSEAGLVDLVVTLGGDRLVRATR